ncbi:hypothetical protein [Bradyrhizobium sp. th.b2]|uniref:hypothetical protein n=1 Tax=Bradyrhizobium sp. th-b2 TaxID=172088 RepID=UPI00048F30BD|nr:hypothetical protein [Bradyrhizobium sp. th.b2]
MSDEQDDLRAELYGKYLAALPQVPVEGRMMPYEWGRLPKSLPFPWVIYGQMFTEYAIEIANAVNNLTNHLARIRAWDLVMPSLNDDDRMEALLEFIQPIATDALSLPYAIRSRFIFAIAHLSHQANQALPNFHWSDDLPEDEKIGFKEAKRCGQHWLAYPGCKDAFEKIFKGDFEAETLDFRHSHNHRFAPHVMMGLSQFITRKKDAEGNLQYVMGYTQPLELKRIADAIVPQCHHCYDAFEAFQALVAEHETAIMKILRSS